MSQYYWLLKKTHKPKLQLITEREIYYGFSVKILVFCIYLKAKQNKIHPSVFCSVYPTQGPREPGDYAGQWAQVRDMLDVVLTHCRPQSHIHTNANQTVYLHNTCWTREETNDAQGEPPTYYWGYCDPKSPNSQSPNCS